MRRGGPIGGTSRLTIAVVVSLLSLVCGAAADAAVPAHGRAWELVTSGPTNSAKLFGTRAWSDDGTHVVYVTLGPTPGAPSGDILAVGVATRGSGGWVMQPIGEPYSQAVRGFGEAPLALGGDFASWVWQSSLPLLPDAPPAPGNAFYRRAPDGTLTLLGPVGNAGETQFVAASADARHVVFQSTAHLLPADAGTEGGDVYEFAGSALRLVGADTTGAALSACGSFVGDGIPADAPFTHPVSADGERIWVSAPATGDCGVPTRVYLREDGTQTVEASASACTRPDCDAPAAVQFAGATPDGSSAFLVTTQQLTNDDVDEAADLYRYDVAGHALTRLSAGPPGVEAGVEGSVVLSSNDGTRVYFVASGALVPGEGAAGRPNLYLSDHGTLRFIATADDLDLHQAAITADGRILTFATAAPLLPSDTDAQVDVYRYDPQLGSLQEVSLGQGGAGDGPFDVTFSPPGNVGIPPLQQTPMRWMSADGRRVLFTTSEPLVAEDVNTTPDVYEWADGTLGLVSSGAGDGTVAYQGLSADGSSAFFSTDETLVPADRNGGDEDLYDARVGGGFPAPPSPPPPCAGDACQGPPGPRLALAVPPTVDRVEATQPPRMRLHPLDRRARARLAASGRAVVVVDVPAPGRISLLVRARVHGRAVALARSAAAPRKAGRVRLQLRLDALARRILRSGQSLRLTLVVRQGARRATQPMTIRLPRKR